MARRFAELEAVLDASGVAETLQALLPTGGRPRQLPVRSLLVGMLLAFDDERPAHLTRVHEALLALPAGDRARLAVEVPWSSGPHLLTYRQLEHLCRRLRKALPAEEGAPGEVLSGVLDALVEASVPPAYKQASADLAVDWTDHESFARPGRTEIDPDASFGHRKGGGPGERSELFFGYYLQFATMVGEVAGRRVPELVRRLVLASARVDPPALVVSALSRLRASGVVIGDVLADSGYSHRMASTFALPLRAAGARLVVDLHPQDRGPKGSFGGAILCNGALYCPATPAALFALTPPPRGASCEEIAAHDARADELARYRLVRLSRPDRDGYHRVACPALAGKLRCPARQASLSLGFDRPEVAEPPAPLPPCCLQQSLTVPPSVGGKTAQRHDYASRSWRESYARRTAVERSNATLKDPARGGTRRGWCRLMGLPGIALFLACHVVVCNLRILESFEERAAEDRRRAARGLAPPTRRRRRTPIDELVQKGRRRSS